MSKSITYSDAGVSIDAANAAVEKIKGLARATFNARTLSEIGTFGGMFDGAFPGMGEPVLVASADGVGTKLKIAFMTGVHDTVGRDLVNHCTNDILVQGARPLFFLDYVATGVLAPDVIVSVVDGVSKGCRENGCVLLGLPSAGLHTNGYSLARKLFFEVAGHGADTFLDELDMTVGEALLQPHLSYLRPLEGLLDTGAVKALAHITGGGLLENLPRVLPEGTAAEIERGSWPVPPVFTLMRELGNVAEPEMFRTFNMGVGMVVICSPGDAAAVKKHLEGLGEKAYAVGRVVAGECEVRIQ